MLYDESVFPEPHVFKPERFLDRDGKLLTNITVDPEEMATFGFGRRFGSFVSL
jgi:cytochrome P450